jgi:hypothetical protein
MSTCGRWRVIVVAVSKGHDVYRCIARSSNSDKPCRAPISSDSRAVCRFSHFPRWRWVRARDMPFYCTVTSKSDSMVLVHC